MPSRALTIASRLLAVAVAATPGPCPADVTLEAVPPSLRWTDAVEPGALRLACAPGEPELAALFEREGLPFRADLLRREPGKVCHLFFRPTVPGFRASPDDDPLTGILFDADPLLYLAATSRNRGEPLGAMREVLGRIHRPLDVGVLIHRVHDASVYDRATRLSFAGTPHRIRLLERGAERNFWWVQDYVKPGVSGRGPTLLVPRRIFEGDPGNADAFEPLLAELCRQGRAVRSQLSWEGGDLQLTRDPRDARRLVLYYGTFAKPYWAETLTPGEFAYALSLELGADRAVDLGGLAPHVDYFTLFLPRARAALVSVPVAGDFDVARAAVDALRAEFGDRAPAVLADLRRSLSAPGPDPRRVRELVERAREEQGQWAFRTDSGLAERTKALVARACPDGRDCFSASSQLRMVEADPAAFEDWVHAVQRAREEQAITTAHLDLVESQLDPVPDELRRRTEEKAAELEAIGFRVIRVPAFRVDLRVRRTWPGVSYVNGLVVDEQVFLPRFGLGDVEERIFRDVGSQLPWGYSVVPIDAQRVLVRNGGLHCLAGLVRSP